MPKVIPILQVNKDNSFIITLSGFYQGFAPVAHINSLTELGNGGHASSMENADILTPDYITQGPALANLTHGDQGGVVDELIYHIMDQPTADGKTYGVGTSKLFRITSTTVSEATGPPAWPQAVTNMANAANYEPSAVLLKANVYGFYNTASAGDIFKMPLSTETVDPDWGSTTPATGAEAIRKAPHPSAKKEDLIVFGNGRNVGFYNATDDELDVDKLDFGNDAEVADVVFHANQWWLAVNYGVTGTHRTQGQIFLWDGGAVSSILDDETAVGLQRIGFIFPINGLVFVAYQDLSFTGGYKIGYISGRRIIPVGHFTGGLPKFFQKTLYKNTILFMGKDDIWSCGAVIEDLPYQISILANSEYGASSGEVIGALAAPYGTPMVASGEAATNYSLQKFQTTYAVDCTWKSVIVPLVFGRNVAHIDQVIVLTNNLGTSARCDLQLQYNQQQSNSGTAKQITTASRRLHRFDITQGKDIEDVNVSLNWANGNATNDCRIRKIIILGHLVEK